MTFKLQKYFYISLYTFKQSYTYWINTLLSVISSIVFINIIYYLWVAVYSSSSSFNSLDLNKTLTYVVIVTIINRLISKNTEGILGNKVISGNIAIDLIRPIFFFNYLFFNRIGSIIFDFVFSIIPLLFVAIVFLKITVITDLITILSFLLSILLAFILVYIMEFILGLVSFWNSQVFGLSLLKTSVVGILAGLTVPLNFYPEFLQNVFFNLPFQAMYYIPMAIYLNLPYRQTFIQKHIQICGISNGSIGLLIEQLIWILVFALLALLFWKVAKRKLVIQGG